MIGGDGALLARWTDGFTSPFCLDHFAASGSRAHRDHPSDSTAECANSNALRTEIWLSSPANSKSEFHIHDLARHTVYTCLTYDLHWVTRPRTRARRCRWSDDA